MTEPKTPLTGVKSRRKTHSKQTDKHARIVSKKIPEIIKALKAKNQEQAFKLYQSIKVSGSSDTLLRISDSLFLFLQTSYKYNDDNFELNLLLAEHFYRSDDIVMMRIHAEKAY